MRTQAVSSVAATLADAYQLVYDCVADPAYGYSKAVGAVKHTPEEIRTILGIV